MIKHAEAEKNFDKKRYDREFQREHYDKMAVVCTIEEGERVEQAAKKAGLSKSEYMKRAILEKIEREEKEKPLAGL